MTCWNGQKSWLYLRGSPVRVIAVYQGVLFIWLEPEQNLRSAFDFPVWMGEENGFRPIKHFRDVFDFTVDAKLFFQGLLFLRKWGKYNNTLSSVNHFPRAQESFRQGSGESVFIRELRPSTGRHRRDPAKLREAGKGSGMVGSVDEECCHRTRVVVVWRGWLNSDRLWCFLAFRGVVKHWGLFGFVIGGVCGK